jgi:hypothetical protein
MSQAIASMGDWSKKFSDLTDAVLHGARTLHESGSYLISEINKELDRLGDCWGQA